MLARCQALRRRFVEHRSWEEAVPTPAPVPDWRDPNDPKHAITIDQLLRMTNGLAVDETDSGFDAWSRTLNLERDIAGYVEQAGLE